MEEKVFVLDQSDKGCREANLLVDRVDDYFGADRYGEISSAYALYSRGVNLMGVDVLIHFSAQNVRFGWMCLVLRG